MILKWVLLLPLCYRCEIEAEKKSRLCGFKWKSCALNPSDLVPESPILIFVVEWERFLGGKTLVIVYANSSELP